MKNDFLFLSRRSLLLRLKRASTETTTTPLLPPYIVSLKTEGDKKSSRTPKKSAKTDCTPLEAKLAPLLNEREMRARSSKRTFGERRARAHRLLLQVPHFMCAYACRVSPFLGLLLPRRRRTRGEERRSFFRLSFSQGWWFDKLFPPPEIFRS